MAWKVLKKQDSDADMRDLPEPPLPPKPPMRVEALKSKREYMVVAKLPMQEIRSYTKEDGTIVDLITIEEYLTEQANAGA